MPCGPAGGAPVQDPRPPGVSRRGSGVGHPGLLGVLGLAAVLRLLIERRSIPGVYQDSLIYLRLAPHAPFGPYSPTRPSGYPVLLRLLDLLPGRDLDVVTAAQHAAGIAVGAVVYGLVVRAGVRRGLALTAAGIAVVDAHTVALEQSVLAETFFTLTVIASLFLVARRPGHEPSVATVAASGLLLGLACTMRTVGLFVVPVWLGWVVLGRFAERRLDKAKRGRTVAAALVAVAAPVVAYCGLHAAEGAGFSLVGSDGWYLYGKVAPVADCAGAEVPPVTVPLCAGPRSRSFEFYLYDPASPAHQLFRGERSADLEQVVDPANNRLLRQFSVGVIRAHPLAFARSVTAEFLRYFGPTTAQNELSLYAKPATPLAWYERNVHLAWWLVSGAAVAGLVLVGLRRRSRDVALLLGTAAALILGAAATSGFNNRYLVPTLPLLAPIVAMALEELFAWRERGKRRPAVSVG